MFKIYDLNYNEVRLPKDKLGYGLKSLDIEIGPVIYNSFYGDTDSGYEAPIKRYPIDRHAHINIMFTASDTVDWRLKRSEVYTFFRRLGVFYIAEDYEPFKLLKVIVDDDYGFERPVNNWGVAEIPLRVLNPIFRQSMHSTLTIDSEGMQFNDKWAYGMGTWFPENYWQYSFKDTNPTFFNAGNVDVKLIQQKESVIELKINQSASWVEIVDDAGNVFRLNRSVSSGDVLRISGNKITLNGNNALGDTNGTFLTARRGWCRWEIRGINQFEFSIDFRYLYD